MRILGIDYGRKRIGLALSDEKGQFAFPHATIPNDATSVDRIRVIVNRENIRRLVIGDTRAANSEKNPITEEAAAFAAQLGAATGIPPEEVREAWSSIEASRFAPKGKEHDDSAAAAIILQRYLDTHARS